ncbi:hypothetical protein [Flavobacterium urocaniciphilum]|uniref:Uncharacterized protein n=1 Tax=Flavobacterium urocaniciphilum TaxID=1299341 RepID=A0A1H9DKZ5_9FLAO|nr:hypothetical protein [Flavobacterium urocaniciphilum]SEQ14134.1 hypothetical protein SAMN05444005_107101 [Flavobacterium urocaniciphilum]
MKKYFVLSVLFFLPIVAYMFFATASHNSLFLPVISKNHADVPSQFVSLNGEKISLDQKITILGFPGNDIEEVKANLFNLNQKIYNKYGGFKDFQMVMIMPDGNQEKIKAIMLEFRRLSNDLKNWHFLFGKPVEIENYFNSFKFKNTLNVHTGTSFVYIIDREKSLRGRKGQKIKGKVEYRECYNTISAAELHNEMSDDVKILLREYRLALKKNKRKDDFRDKIEQEVSKK